LFLHPFGNPGVTPWNSATQNQSISRYTLPDNRSTEKANDLLDIIVAKWIGKGMTTNLRIKTCLSAPAASIYAKSRQMTKLDWCHYMVRYRCSANACAYNDVEHDAIRFSLDYPLPKSGCFGIVQAEKRWLRHA